MKVSSVVPSGAALTARFINEGVTRAKSAGKSSADFVVKDQAVIDKAVETYGKDRVKVTASSSKLLNIKV